MPIIGFFVKLPSIMVTESQRPDMTLLDGELSLLRRISESGLYEVINSENFPKLFSTSPDFLTLHIMDAISNRVSFLNRVLHNSTNDETREATLNQIAVVTSYCNEQNFINKSPKKITPTLWMYDNERENLKYVIWLGDHNAINMNNFPSLLNIDPKIVNSMRAEAVQNRINKLHELKNNRTKFTGYSGVNQIDELVKSLDDTIKELGLLRDGFLTDE